MCCPYPNIEVLGTDLRVWSILPSVLRTGVNVLPTKEEIWVWEISAYRAEQGPVTPTTIEVWLMKVYIVHSMTICLLVHCVSDTPKKTYDEMGLAVGGQGVVYEERVRYAPVTEPLSPVSHLGQNRDTLHRHRRET
jgi:hypothetical protein